MTPAVSAPTMSGRARGGGRVQGALAIAGLVASVVVTVVLVTSPPSSAGPGEPGRVVAGDVLPRGVRVEVRGGEAIAAYGLADRLTLAGASLRGVEPSPSSAEVGASTMIVYYDRGSLAAAERIQSMLGSGTLQRRQVFRPEVDVTIVLGKDLPRL